MKAAFSRHLQLLEGRLGQISRRVHIITATDEDDAGRQMVELIAAGAVHGRDGFLCITGKPL